MKTGHYHGELIAKNRIRHSTAKHGVCRSFALLATLLVGIGPPTVATANPTVPTPVSPIGGVEVPIGTGELAFTWSDTGAANYRLVVRRASDNQPITVSGLNLFQQTSVQIPGFEPNETYEWHVRSEPPASDWSSWKTFTTSDNVPTLLLPMNGQEFATSTQSVAFSWEGTGAPRYRLAINDQTGAPLRPLEEQWVNGTSATVSGFQAGQTYTWRVQSNYHGQIPASPWSTLRTLQIAPEAPPPEPVLGQPSGEVLIDGRPTFSWSNTGAADNLTVRVKMPTNHPLDNEWLEVGNLPAGTTSLDWPDDQLEFGYNYQWQVVASNGNGSTSSGLQDFKMTSVPVTLWSGGSNMHWYSVDQSCDQIDLTICPRSDEDGSAEHYQSYGIIKEYDQPGVRNTVQTQLAAMNNVGQDTVRLGLFFSTGAGTAGTSRVQLEFENVELGKTVEKRIKGNLRSNIANVLQDAKDQGMQTVYFSLFPLGESDPHNGTHQETRAEWDQRIGTLLTDTMAPLLDDLDRLFSPLRAQGLNILLDLSNERIPRNPSSEVPGECGSSSAIDSLDCKHHKLTGETAYYRSLWSYYVSNFDSTVATISIGAGGGGDNKVQEKLQNIRAVFGNDTPGFLDFHVYYRDCRNGANQAGDFEDRILGEIGYWLDVHAGYAAEQFDIVIGETSYNNLVTANAMRRGIEALASGQFYDEIGMQWWLFTPRNVRFVTQWPNLREPVNHPPAGYSYPAAVYSPMQCQGVDTSIPFPALFDALEDNGI